MGGVGHERTGSPVPQFTPEGRLRRGRILVALDANRCMKDLVGFYGGRRGRKYFKRLQRPQLADLSG
jgi:hypothetical protein